MRGKVLLLVAWLGVLVLLAPDSAAPQAFTQRPVAHGNLEGAISVYAVACASWAAKAERTSKGGDVQHCT